MQFLMKRTAIQFFLMASLLDLIFHLLDHTKAYGYRQSISHYL